METLYDVLEVSKKASKEVIDKAYKTLAKKYHPDLQSEADRKHAEEMMKKINEAYDVLNDEFKRNEYDKQLEEQERINNARTTASYNNYYNTNANYSNEYKNKSTYEKTNESDWREKFSKLSKSEQQRILKNIEKEANAEYRKLYVDYFRSLGFKIKHKWTPKDFLVISIAIFILIFVLFILLLIPSTHQMLAEIYEGNIFIKLIVDLFIGIGNGIIKFFKSLI